MPEPAQNDRLREEFNRWAEAGRGEGMEHDHLPIVLPVLDRLGLAPTDNILDVGCGAGWLARLLAEQVPEGRVVGIDISDEMIRRARRKHSELDNVMFAVGEAEEIPWDANFFDRVISVESAYYWPDPRRALREIFRVLIEGGSAWMLINYYRDNPHLLSLEDWSAMFRESGFAGVQHARIPDPTPAPETYQGRWFRDATQLRAFREQGALLVHGAKPRL
jgi:SAM-dependent methyltransferase